MSLLFIARAIHITDNIVIDNAPRVVIKTSINLAPSFNLQQHFCVIQEFGDN